MPDLIIGGLALAVGILPAALLRYRRRLWKAEKSRETDAVTGLGNVDYLLRCYRQIVNDKNQVLYSNLTTLCGYVHTWRIKHYTTLCDYDSSALYTQQKRDF